METKSSRAIEINELVRFIRMADISSARRSMVKIMERGERISREIIKEYERMESSPASHA